MSCYNGAMLPSGNDAANVYREAVAAKGLELSCVCVPTPSATDTSETGETIEPTEPSLMACYSAIMMNNQSRRVLGLVNTNFTNTNGSSQ